MTVLIPKRFGCGAKIELLELHKHLSVMGERGRRSYALDNRDNGSSSVRSIDKIFQAGVELTSFAHLALIHAGADVLCGGGKPSIVDVCFEFGPELSEEGRVELSSALFSAAESQSIRVGKCHSTMGPVTALTLAVSGERELRWKEPGKSGNVIITRRLGGLRNLYLSALRGESADPGLVSQMGIGHFHFLEQVHHLISHAVDVSGFGLIGALHEIAWDSGNQVEASLTDDLWLQGFGGEEPACLTSDVLGFADTENLAERFARRASTREFCGPLLLVAEDAGLDEIHEVALRMNFNDLSVIGRISLGEPSVRLSS